MKRSILYFSLVIVVLFSGCSTREVHNLLLGATEQRLITHSINKLMAALPHKDFDKLKGNKVFLESFFIMANNQQPLKTYADKRLEMELITKFNCTLVPSAADADICLRVFYTSIGTDRDQFGLTMPPVVIPGFPGTSGGPLLAVDMYHGISEMYYYIMAKNSNQKWRGDKLKAVIRTDSFATPFFSFPVTNLK